MKVKVAVWNDSGPILAHRIKLQGFLAELKNMKISPDESLEPRQPFQLHRALHESLQSGQPEQRTRSSTFW